jgi:hypothetical protein
MFQHWTIANLPAIVIIAVNVQHLLALDTEDTDSSVSGAIHEPSRSNLTQKGHIPSDLNRTVSSDLGLQ